MSQNEPKALNFLEQGALIKQMLETSPDKLSSLLRDLKIKKRKAYYLAEVARTLAELRVSEKRLLKIGWTKLQIVHTHLTSENCETLLALAEDLPVYRLREYLATGEVEQPKHCVQLYFNNEEFEVFQQTLATYGNGHGQRERETALIAALLDLPSKTGSLKLKPHT